AIMTTPYEKFKSLPETTQYRKPGVTFEYLEAIAYAISDHEAARRLNEARATRFRSINQAQPPAA
ncbi:MAG: integrase, partial [Chromatiaceae bacterium]